MTTPHDLSTQAYWQAPADPAAAQAYLSLSDSPLEIARLSAALLPPLEQYDLPRAADLAVSLRLEAAAALIRQREKMLAAMNYRTILELARRLDISEILHDPAASARQLEDSIAGPVIRQFQAANERSYTESSAEATGQIEHALALADSRTSLPRPPDQALLEPCLRYAINEPALRWEDLQEVFYESLALTLAREEAYRLEHPADVADFFDDLAELRQSHPHPAEEIREYIASFAPGRKMPALIAAGATARRRMHWAEDKKINRDLLTLFATHFHDFWQQHRKAYLALFKARQARSQAKKRAALVSNAEQSHKLWLTRTTRLIAFLHEHSADLASPAECRQLLDRFARQELKSAASISSLIAFFSTLLTVLHGRAPTSEVRRLLKAGMPEAKGKAYSKEIAADTIAACRELLQEAFLPGSQAPPEKKRKLS